MSKQVKSICHITSIHPRYDIRIFYKECRGLSLSYQVYLLVADGLGNEEREGIKIIDVGKFRKGRLKRMFLTCSQLYETSLSLDCNVFHFHDSEFLYFGNLLKRKGKKVLYDAHEDLPRQILGKNYIAPLLRRLISNVSEVIENYYSKKFDGIICATPTIQERFIKLNENVISVCNFPSRDEFAPPKKWVNKTDRICYLGGISEVRGVNELLGAMELLPAETELDLVGDVENESIRRSIVSFSKSYKIIFFGIVDRFRVKEILCENKIGIVALHPVPNHISSLPVKMFEYMAAGIPVIASDFPLWKEIIDGNRCGLCINPFSSRELADAVIYLLGNTVIAEAMGQNGRDAIQEKYNWETENIKLLNLYSSLF